MEAMKKSANRGLLVSKGWIQAVAIVVVFGFFVLGLLAYRTYRDEPPIPARTVGEADQVLFTRQDVVDGQGVFLRNGLMEYGSIFGHGAYLGAALGRDLPEYQAQRISGGFKAENVQHDLAAEFTPQGVTVRGENIFWKIALRGYGYGVVLKPQKTVAPRATLNRVEYRHGALTEWYVNGPAGLEQGFTIAKPPGQANHRPLTIALSLSKDSTAIVENRTGLRLLARDGKAGLRYSGLSAADGAGKKLPAWLELRGDQLLLRVNDIGGRYPVMIDPWVQLADLTASDGAAGDGFGSSVSVSGNTVVVGSPNSNNRRGAAYVFEKPVSGWANITQTAKLTAWDGADAKFGSSVAISGNTIAVGAPSQPVFAGFKPNDLQGAAYVFVKPVSGWADMAPTAKLTASDGAPGDFMGSCIGISGNTIVVGANQIDSLGAGGCICVCEAGWWLKGHDGDC